MTYLNHSIGWVQESLTDGMSSQMDRDLTQKHFDEVCRLAKLGQALEMDNWYKCETCGKPQILPAILEIDKKEADIDAREYTYWTAKYCSHDCFDKDYKRDGWNYSKGKRVDG